MRIFILNPLLFTDKLRGIARKRQPLELAYIASLLRNEHEVRLLDANALDFELSVVLEKIKEFEPEILILTSTPLDRWEVPSHSHIKLLAENLVKTVNNLSIPYIILTGAHGSLMPEWVLKKTKVSFVVRSEPEMTVYNLINAIVKQNDFATVKGISYLKDEVIIHNEKAERIKNLDEMPLPAYDMLPMEKYSYTFADIPKPFSIMLTSRGCPFSCSYCLKVMMPDFYITRSAGSVIREMKLLVEEFGIKGIYFQDWEFMIDKKRVANICDLIINNGLEIKWGCNGRATDADEELVKKMKVAGCVRINVGFESGSQKILDLANKRAKVEDFVKVKKMCEKYSINTGIYSLLNLPGEDRKTIEETEKLLAENNWRTICEPNLPIPYPGTALYEELTRQIGKPVNWDELDKYAGRVRVKLPPWLARLYRWHYKNKYLAGKMYFLRPAFVRKLVKRIKII